MGQWGNGAMGHWGNGASSAALTRACVESTHRMPKLPCNQTTVHNGRAPYCPWEVKDADKTVVAKRRAAASYAATNSLPVYVKELRQEGDEPVPI